jgi:putative membrane protein
MGNIERAVGLTDYFVSLPPSRYFVLAIILLGVLLGIGLNLGKYDTTELILKGSFQGIFILTIPALLSAGAIKILIMKVPFKRIIATMFIGEIVYAITYSTGMFVSSFNPLYAKFVFFIGAALVFIIWYTIARLVFVLKWRSFIFATIQLMFHLIFLLSSSLVDFGTEPIGAIAKFYIASLVFFIAIYVFFIIINAPMRRNFGYSSTDAIAMFAAQWLDQDKEIESAFENVGENVKVPVSVFAFKRKKDEMLMVIPSVHFGPFGNLGGSEFTQLIADDISKRYGAGSMVFHAPATHDLNPSSSSEITKVMDAIDSCMKRCEYKNAKVSFLEGRRNECFSEIMKFNDGKESAFVSLSRAPLVTEDINFGLGAFLSAEAEKSVDLAVIVDQHNAETGEVTSFEPGSLVGHNYFEAITDALSKKNAFVPLSVGFSQRSVVSPFVGKAGIKIAVFEAKPVPVAIILLDSNGVTPEFREKLMAEAMDAAAKHKMEIKPIIFTTDTHQINSVRGVLNPLREDAAIVKELKAAVSDAIIDISDAKFYSGKQWFEIKVLGAKQSIEIVSTVNSIVAVAKIAAPIIILGGIVAIVAIISGL